MVNNDAYELLDGAFGFDDEINVDSSERAFPVLPAGTYPFMIEKVERTHVSDQPNANGKVSKYAGNAMAAVTFLIKGTDSEGNQVEVHRTENYILHSAFLWKISQLFVSVGLAKDGEKYRMNWPALPTRTGTCEVGVTTFTKRDGTKGESNQIKKCLPAAQPAWAGGF